MTTFVKLEIAAGMGISLLMTHFLMARDVDRQATAVPSTVLHGFPNNYSLLPLTISKYVYAVMKSVAVMMFLSRSLNFTFNEV